MRRLLPLIALTGIACFAQVPSWLESEPNGWKDIMPAASFAGWTRLPFMTTNPLDPVSQWHVDPANRVLVCEGDHGHEFLRYDQEIGDVIFHAEYRFTKIEGKTGYNSGVMVRNSADGKIWFQAQTGAEGTGYLMGSYPVDGGQAQRLNLRAEMKENRVKPAGEWNVFEFRAQGPKMTLWVNGGITNEKADIPVLKGFLGLEAEGFRIEFRNLKIKPL
jgi:hypothetical protein